MTMVIALLSTAVLGAAAVLVVIRIIRGPSMLDRVVGLDVLIAIIVCALGLEAAINRHSTTLPILIGLSLLGFVGSISVARFIAPDDDEDAGETGAPTTLGQDS